MASTTTDPYAQPTGDADNQIWTAPGVGTGTDAGASGSSSGSSNISQGGIIAIIVVVVVVSVVGVATAILFYMAKKREWKVRETIRRSARKVVVALTPRRSQFPDSVRNARSGRTRIADDVPPTPRLHARDLEKGKSETQTKVKAKTWSSKTSS